MWRGVTTSSSYVFYLEDPSELTCYYTSVYEALSLWYHPTVLQIPRVTMTLMFPSWLRCVLALLISYTQAEHWSKPPTAPHLISICHHFDPSIMTSCNPFVFIRISVKFNSSSAWFFSYMNTSIYKNREQCTQPVLRLRANDLLRSKSTLCGSYEPSLCLAGNILPPNKSWWFFSALPRWTWHILVIYWFILVTARPVPKVSDNKQKYTSVSVSGQRLSPDSSFRTTMMSLTCESCWNILSYFGWIGSQLSSYTVMKNDIFRQIYSTLMNIKVMKQKDTNMLLVLGGGYSLQSRKNSPEKQ